MALILLSNWVYFVEGNPPEEIMDEEGNVIPEQYEKLIKREN